MPRASTMPSSPPSNPSSNDSLKNKVRIVRELAPSALEIPIARVRPKTRASIKFVMFKAAITNAAEANNADLKGWWDIEPIIRKVGRIWDSVVLVITFLLFVSTALSVSNIIYMMVAERTVEIGTLMAIGARPFDVSLLFSLEAVLIGLFGGVSGMVVGTLAVVLMDIFGVPFDSPFGSDQLIVHPKISLGLALVVFAFGIIICQISALAPSRKAARVEPVRAFRGQIT